MQRSSHCRLGAIALVAACSSGQADPAAFVPGVGSPVIQSFAPSAAVVFVGERARLTAVFDGDSAVIDGIGPVESGVGVETPPLSRTATFALRVGRGNQEVRAETTVRASYRNRIRVLGDAPIAQTNHLAAAMSGGRAIAMGGNTSDSPLVPDSTLTQIFDPATEAFTPGPDLLFAVQAQVFASIAPLSGGGFLVIGTGPNAPVGAVRAALTQRLDSAADRFTRAGDATTSALSNRAASSLLDGGALVTGGLEGGDNPVSGGADRFDASSGQWRAVPPMLHVRVGHTATLLRDGRVLIAGGLTCCLPQPNPSPELVTETAEIYDPATNAFAPTGSLIAARFGHAAASLADGRVLISGGEAKDPAQPLLKTEIFDPGTGRFTSGDDLQAPRDSHSAVALSDGRILVIGGEVPSLVAGRVGVGVPSTEIFDPAAGRWSAGPTLDKAFFTATVTMLESGKVLIFGGQDAGGAPQAAAALFE